MRWLRVAYSMRAAACVMLAAVHLLVWFKQPGRTHLAFSVIAIFLVLRSDVVHDRIDDSPAM